MRPPEKKEYMIAAAKRFPRLLADIQAKTIMPEMYAHGTIMLRLPSLSRVSLHHL
jgi:hypothetical protein